MKNEICFLILGILLVSCGERFLELQSESVADVQDVYKSEEDFEQAIIGAYDELQSGGQYGGSFQAMMETRADIVGEESAAFRDGIYYELDRFLLRPTNPIVRTAWSSVYKGIFRCNMILEKLEESQLNVDFKLQVEAEARFIRALSYFNAIRFWGDLPLILQPISPDDALELGRTGTAEISEVISEDLNFAISHLPTVYRTSDAGRATQGAAKALLAKLYVTEERYQEAEQILSELVSGQYSLLANIDEVFDPRNEINDEILFSVRWKKLVEETDLFFSRATNVIVISADFLESFEAGDPRRDLTELTLVGSYSVPNKYVDPSGTDGKTGRDFPVLRFSDVLLMYAETLNEIGYVADGKAFDAINEVRSRVGLSALTATQFPNQASFREAVFRERGHELALEGHRWFDLVRAENAASVLEPQGISVEPFQFLYPIPQTEIDRINNSIFTQNPGYE